jgi:hypothetical protein
MAPHSSQMMTRISSLEPLPAGSYIIPDSIKVSQEQRGQFGFFISSSALIIGGLRRNSSVLVRGEFL